MSDPNDPRDDRPDPFPAFGGQAGFSPFPPLEETPVEPAVSVAAPVAVAPDPPSDWNRGADAHDLVAARENRLKAMARFAFPPGPPPDDEGLAARDRRWTTRAILTVTVFMAIFNAGAPANWARQQAPGWVTDTVRGVSEVWAAQVSLLSADLPRQGVRDLYEAARDAEWAGTRRTEPEA